MNSEKVKEIKELLRCMNGEKACTNCYINDIAEEQGTFCINVIADMTLALINELESENERLNKEKEDLRLFDIALGNGKVDMTLGGNTAKSFINAIVQIFKQNNATNFLATTIETISSGNKYSLVIQKENGQTPSEKLTELKDRIAELEKENADYKDTNNILRTRIDKSKELSNRNGELLLKQFAERLKESASQHYVSQNGVRISDITYSISNGTINKILKEFINKGDEER